MSGRLKSYTDAMTGRAVAETLVGFVLTTLLVLVAAGLLEFSQGADPAEAFLDSGPRLIFGTFAIPGAVWAVLLLIGNIRNRRRASGWAYLTNQLSAVVVAVLGVVGWLVVAMVQGGWALLIVGIVMFVALLFVGASIPALLLTHFAFFRHGAAPSAGAPQGESAAGSFQALGLQEPE
jgi:hypothetical protein